MKSEERVALKGLLSGLVDYLEIAGRILPENTINMLVFSAIANQEPELARRIVAAYSNLKFDFQIGKCTPLNKAIKLNQVVVVKILIDIGVDVNQMADELPLIMAVREKNHAIAEILLDNGANPNAVSQNNTPILEAVRRDDRKMIKLLLAYNADINLGSKMTPLYLATRLGDFKLIKYLIRQGAKANALNLSGLSILSVAIHQNKDNDYQEIIDYLYRKGARLTKNCVKKLNGYYFLRQNPYYLKYLDR